MLATLLKIKDDAPTHTHTLELETRKALRVTTKWVFVYDMFRLSEATTTRGEGRKAACAFATVMQKRQERRQKLENLISSSFHLNREEFFTASAEKRSQFFSLNSLLSIIDLSNPRPSTLHHS